MSNSASTILGSKPSPAQFPLETLVLELLSNPPSLASSANPATDVLAALATCVGVNHSGYRTMALWLDDLKTRYARA